MTIFDTIEYMTYEDKAKKMKVYAFDNEYDYLKTNFKLLENMYKVNETDTFFGYTFFLNPIKDDGIVRFVTKVDGRSVGVEISKRWYKALKKLLVK